MNTLIILDRDGVVNEDSDNYIRSVDEWIPVPGSIEAIARLSKAGYTLAVATNQSGIARGYYPLSELEAMHTRMNQLVQEQGGHIDCVRYCPHGPDEGCQCRKPETGLVDQIEQHLNMSASGAWLVGDSLKDLQCARRKHCQPALVRTGKGERTLAKGEGLEGVPVFESLADFADHLLGHF
ncbi:D-glycero-beta-D-manno-heptose 1,7-bisphosphate 7-phosphatase [Endozoicomonas euniceicola]|uniref:D,D-heptose 1,7-bisphosphate phosphatase n=1 Tax=Endozoicomonas euniceicola TaxID=1234143 RepID=A0ABY6H001_9GAMM|nr:D-glycero-beta-D-manno-heptose 1,7-bisphosphate 7-phosphatase [Endozoicomonas euniceicola]UYM18372.1 D-glycero-beta-D-manno-heptose 1,7-bisphosphate 7-phosphatase [Endozoicomonas euniceicola]